MTVVSGDDAYKLEEDNKPVHLIEAELNHRTRDLYFSKQSAQLLDSRLKEKHLLASWITFYWYRDH